MSIANFLNDLSSQLSPTDIYDPELLLVTELLKVMSGSSSPMLDHYQARALSQNDTETYDFLTLIKSQATTVASGGGGGNTFPSGINVGTSILPTSDDAVGIGGGTTIGSGRFAFLYLADRVTVGADDSGSQISALRPAALDLADRTVGNIVVTFSADPNSQLCHLNSSLSLDGENLSILVGTDGPATSSLSAGTMTFTNADGNPATIHNEGHGNGTLYCSVPIQIDGGGQMNMVQTSSGQQGPAYNPPSGYSAIYFKADKNLYFRDENGVEKQVATV